MTKLPNSPGGKNHGQKNDWFVDLMKRTKPKKRNRNAPLRHEARRREYLRAGLEFKLEVPGELSAVSKPISQFWQGCILGFTGPIHLLSLRKFRRGERYMIGTIARYGLPIEIRDDFTLWNSIRFRWKLWFLHKAAWKVSS